MIKFLLLSNIITQCFLNLGNYKLVFIKMYISR